MNPQQTILILYARYGAGHIQVAEALQHELEQHGAKAVLLDLFREAHPLVDAASQFFYRKSFTWFPALYGWSYYRTQDMKNDAPSSRSFNAFGLQTLAKTIEDVKPIAVINTFPMLAMPEFRRRTGRRIPTYAVLTDFVLHNRWMHPEIDRYYVATDDLARNLIEKGVSPEQVDVSGIPLRPAFGHVADKASLLKKFGLDPQKKRVLLAAGGYGAAWHWDTFIDLFHTNGWEVMIVCGRNESLRSELVEKTSTLPFVHVHGYVKHMEELMKSADLLVTKAGGITLAEALSLSLPTVILAPVPGQERENARYLEARGAAQVIWNEQDIQNLHALVRNPALLDTLREQAAALGKQGSAAHVACDILNRSKEVKARHGETSLALHP